MDTLVIENRYECVERIDEHHWKVSSGSTDYRIKPSGIYVDLLKAGKPYLPKFIEEFELNDAKMCVYEEVKGDSLYCVVEAESFPTAWNLSVIHQLTAL